MKQTIQKKYQQGLSLLETMGLIALLGVWVAVTLPYYNAFEAQSEVTEAFNLVNMSQDMLQKTYTQKGVCPNNSGSDPVDAAISGLTAALNVHGKYVAKVTFGGRPVPYNSQAVLSQEQSTGCVAEAGFRDSKISTVLSGKLLHFTLMQTPTGFRMRCDKDMSTTVDPDFLSALCK